MATTAVSVGFSQASLMRSIRAPKASNVFKWMRELYSIERRYAKKSYGRYGHLMPILRRKIHAAGFIYANIQMVCSSKKCRRQLHNVVCDTHTNAYLCPACRTNLQIRLPQLGDLDGRKVCAAASR